MWLISATAPNHGVVLANIRVRAESRTPGHLPSDAGWKAYGRNNVLWQIGELGRVDAGGGGTVAKYIADLNVDAVDLGVPVLSMHSPFEVVSKLDVYMAHKAFSALLGRK